MTYTLPLKDYRPDLYEPRPGLTIQGDEWPYASRLIEGDDLDKQYFGTRLRYDRADKIIPSLPVKIEITGRVVHVTPTYGTRKVRVMITTWDSNEQPVSFRGWLFI